MIGLHYSKSTVLSMFLQDEGNLAPSAADVEQFESDIFDNRDASLVNIMTQMAIPTDFATKSLILGYSNLTPGGSIEEMIRSACRYYLNTRNL